MRDLATRLPCSALYRTHHTQLPLYWSFQTHSSLSRVLESLSDPTGTTDPLSRLLASSFTPTKRLVLGGQPGLAREIGVYSLSRSASLSTPSLARPPRCSL